MTNERYILVIDALRCGMLTGMGFDTTQHKDWWDFYLSHRLLPGGKVVFRR